ncbi:ABC transporter ATP-binding protein [Pelagibius sp.]|uniref:ABC transporter ATP-binding protein n=1 Tax=Pelagibius sp. TaxID=1931238 RepID=UPI003BAFC22D
MIRALLTVAGPGTVRVLRWNLAGLVAEAVLMGLGFTLLVPFFDAFLSGDLGAAWNWLAAIAGVFAVYVVLRFRTQLAGYRAAVGLAGTLFSRLGDHIAKLPLGWFATDRVGPVGRLTSQGVIDVMGVPAHLLRPVITAFVTPATVVAVMFLFDWRLAAAALVTAPLAALTYRWSGRLVQRTDRRSDAAGAEAAGRIVEFAQKQPVLRAFGRAAEGHRQLDAALREQRDAGRAQILTVAPALAAFVLVVQLAFTIILLFGVNLALGGEIDLPELLALLVLAVRYVEPLIAAADLGGALRISSNSLERMDDLLSTAPLAEPVRSLRPSDSAVVFDDVHFAYGAEEVLKGVSFSAPERKMTAIVGPSGSGKTTILRLIARFWDVNAGQVGIGGADVRDIANEDLMARISVVFQDVYLFDGTIEENIRLGREGASDQEVSEAARLACVDEIAARLPAGMASRVGEGGTALSGGERQRVSIARAILKDAPIVLLDEATAALDPMNEAAVQQALRALTREKTLVVVAHRLQTVRGADRIIVLDKGRITEQGSHDELLAAEGRYASFWNERLRAAGWRLAANADREGNPNDGSN